MILCGILFLFGIAVLISTLCTGYCNLYIAIACIIAIVYGFYFYIQAMEFSDLKKEVEELRKLISKKDDEK